MKGVIKIMIIDISSKVPDDKSEYCKINLAGVTRSSYYQSALC